MADQMQTGLSGISRSMTPIGRKASTAALTVAGSAGLMSSGQLR
jgi:hypothetical protein